MINTRLRSIIRKEFIQIIRDPRTLMLGYAATTDVRNVPLAIFDQDRLRAITEEKSSAQNLEQALDTAGLHDVRIQETAPTLEDVFLSLAGN